MEHTNIEVFEVNAPKVGRLNVHVQGKRSPNEEVILTVHDLGCNHNQMLDFLSNPRMEQLLNKSVWVHVVLPGQGDGEQDLPDNYVFPSLSDLADDLIHVLDHLDIKQTVLFGEGAGANILARFAMQHDDRVLGAVLIHCTGATTGFLESIRDRGVGRRLSSVGMNPADESYLVLHRFGTIIPTNKKHAGDIPMTYRLKENSSEQDLKNMVASFRESLNNNINPKNLHGFIRSYMERSNITSKISALKCPTMFMTGSLATHADQVQNLFSALQKTLKDNPSKRAKVELIQIDGVANVLTERPEKVAECLQYFLQGLGFVSHMPILRSRIELNRTRSMEDYDQPLSRSSQISSVTPVLRNEDGRGLQIQI